jgi:serine/threonine-protein kinase HipA
MPANEHLTMQIARQVYGIETAENALIFFKNGAQAYITRRFDVISFLRINYHLCIKFYNPY